MIYCCKTVKRYCCNFKREVFLPPFYFIFGLNNFIMCESSLLALRGCSNSAPSTGLYIDQVGLTEGLLSQFISDQYDTPLEIFEDKRSLAWKKIQTEMLNNLNSFMKADTVIDNRRVGQINTNSTSTTTAQGAGSYVGVRLIMSPQRTSFLKMFISELMVYIDSVNTNVDVLVFDLVQNKLIETITYSQGSTEQYISKTYLSKRRKLDIALVYESTVDAIKTVPKYGNCTDCSGRIKDVVICPFVNGIGVQLDWDGTTISNLANKSVTGGVSVNYNIECDRESYLCSIGSTMSMALLYATAIEIYDYALTISPNDRVNTAVSINRDEMFEARDIMAKKYNTEMNTLLTNFRMPSDSYCFNCKENLKYITALP